MTVDDLSRCNAVYTRISKTKKILDAMIPVNPVSGITRKMPITIASGLSSTIDFDIRAEEDISTIQKLDNSVYNAIVDILKNYVFQLENEFKEM